MGCPLSRSEKITSEFFETSMAPPQPVRKKALGIAESGTSCHARPTDSRTCCFHSTGFILRSSSMVCLKRSPEVDHDDESGMRATGLDQAAAHAMCSLRELEPGPSHAALPHRWPRWS